MHVCMYIEHTYKYRTYVCMYCMYACISAVIYFEDESEEFQAINSAQLAVIRPGLVDSV